MMEWDNGIGDRSELSGGRKVFSRTWGGRHVVGHLLLRTWGNYRQPLGQMNEVARDLGSGET